jgi:hypothetical protein
MGVFFYDAGVARDVLPGHLLSRSSAEFVSRFLESRTGGRAGRSAPPILHTATNGEAYGHHTAFGDRTLAFALTQEAALRGLRVSNYAEYLSHHPPTDEVRLRAPQDAMGTSWSCPHGLGRWTRDCGCDTGRPGWSQAWRTPLRAALDLVRDHAHEFFEDAGMDVIGSDPWAARDNLIEWSVRPAWRDWLKATMGKRALGLFDIELHVQLMYASCAWLQPDIGSLETRLALRRAARVINLQHQLGGSPPETGFLERLAEARSNRTELGTGADIYRRSARTEAR